MDWSIMAEIFGVKHLLVHHVAEQITFRTCPVSDDLATIRVRHSRDRDINVSMAPPFLLRGVK
jgi:hypothetical protein